MSGYRRSGLKHGLRRPFCLGATPKGAEWVARQIGLMRAELERVVVEMKGQIDVVDAACIATCCRWERHALYAQRWLSKNIDDMTLDQKLNFSREITKASESRDRAIRALGISSDDRKRDALTTLYSEPAEAGEGD